MEKVLVGAPFLGGKDHKTFSPTCTHSLAHSLTRKPRKKRERKLTLLYPSAARDLRQNPGGDGEKNMLEIP